MIEVKRRFAFNHKGAKDCKGVFFYYTARYCIDAAGGICFSLEEYLRPVFQLGFDACILL